MPPPVPPRVKLGRMIAGRPTIASAGARLLQRMGDGAARALEADLGHRVAEFQPVLGLVDHLGLGADQLDAVLLQHAVAASAIAVFSAVWPPMVGSSASGVLPR